MGVEQDPRGSKLERVKKKKKKPCLLAIINFFSSGVGCRGKRSRGASLEQEAAKYQLGEFNDLFDRDKAVPIQ